MTELWQTVKVLNGWVRFSLAFRWLTSVVVAVWLITVATTPLSTVTVVPERYDDWLPYLPALATTGVVTTMVQLYVGWYAVLMGRTWWTTTIALAGALLVTTSLVGLFYGWVTNVNGVVLFRVGGVRFVSVTALDAVLKTLLENSYQTMVAVASSSASTVITPDRWNTFAAGLLTAVTAAVVVSTPPHQLTQVWNTRALHQVCDWLEQEPPVPVAPGTSWWWYVAVAGMVAAGFAVVCYFASGEVPPARTALSDKYLRKLKELEIEPGVKPCPYAKKVGEILSNWLVDQQNQLHHQRTYAFEQLDRTRGLVLNQSYIDKALTILQSNALSTQMGTAWKHRLLAFLTALIVDSSPAVVNTAFEETSAVFERYIRGVTPLNPPPDVQPIVPSVPPVVVPDVLPTTRGLPVTPTAAVPATPDPAKPERLSQADKERRAKQLNSFYFRLRKKPHD